MKKIKSYLNNTLPYKLLFLLFSKNSYLYKTGWLKSIIKNGSVNKENLPIPWFSYAALSFIENRIQKHHKVLEYGSGNSTIWFSERVNNLYSIESDKKWYDKVKRKISNNVEYFLCEMEFNKPYLELAFLDKDHETNYSKKAKELNQLFDIIIIDGVDRNNCIKNCIDLLSPSGVFIVDNTDEFYHSLYKESMILLDEQGYKQLEFSSMCAIYPIYTSTSIFYKTNNCLNI